MKVWLGVLFMLIGVAAGDLLDEVLQVVSNRTKGPEELPEFETEFRWDKTSYRVRITNEFLEVPTLQSIRATHQRRAEGGKRLEGQALAKTRLTARYILAELESQMVSSGDLEAQWEGRLAFLLRAKGTFLGIQYKDLEGGFTSVNPMPYNPLFRTPISPEHLDRLSENITSVVMGMLKKASENIQICEVIPCW